VEHRRALSAVLAFLIMAFGLATSAGPASAAYNPEDPAQKAEYDEAYAAANDAYNYGFPILDMARTFKTSTSVNVPNGRGGNRVNEFSHFRNLADAKDRTVVLPNADTLYSMAWIDLSKGPQVIHSKKGTKRFHVFELLDPWTENFANIGSPVGGLPDGDYLVVKKNWKGKVPKGLKLIRSPYDRIWVIGRTIIYGKSDLGNVRKTQNNYRIVPLKKWNPKRPLAFKWPKPKKVDDVINQASIPGLGAGDDPAEFYDAIGDQIKRFPPPARDKPELVTLKNTLGIGAGLHPVADGKLSDAQLAAMRDIVTGAQGRFQAGLLQTYLSAFDAHNGWLVAKTGTYGTDYVRRAQIAKFGLGAPLPYVSVYPVAIMDHDKSLLTGTKRYVVHFSPETSHPPVKFFWSMTLYDNDSFFVDNPINRYLVNDRSNLKYNEDGSLDIYIQPDQPADPDQARNWLPSPAADAAQPGFRLTMRLYGLSQAGIKGLQDGTGWQGPTILPCGVGNETTTGIACAALPN